MYTITVISIDKSIYICSRWIYIIPIPSHYITHSSIWVSMCYTIYCQYHWVYCITTRVTTKCCKYQCYLTIIYIIVSRGINRVVTVRYIKITISVCCPNDRVRVCAVTVYNIVFIRANDRVYSCVCCRCIVHSYI